MKGSKNYRNGKFENEAETPMMNGDASYFKMIKKQFESDPLREPQKPLPTVKPKFLPPPTDDTFRLTWFGHSSYLLQIAGKNILVDPVFSQRTSPFQFIGTKQFLGTDILTPSELPDIDLLIQTHDHYDHLDYLAILELKEKIKKVVAPLGVAPHLERWGIAPEIITELDWSENCEPFAGMTLTAATARHFSGRGLTNRASTLWTSYILKTPDKTIYIGGDSGYGTHFKEIGEKYGPFDLSILECGQYNEWWSHIHMMPEEVVQAHLDLKSKVLLPVHWGKFRLAFHPWKEPIERLMVKAKAENITVITPKIGETVYSDKPQEAQTVWWGDVA
jgi:L-ascorbate metabolism protein UlaG (beta-lactamase superfamily)